MCLLDFGLRLDFRDRLGIDDGLEERTDLRTVEVRHQPMLYASVYVKRVDSRSLDLGLQTIGAYVSRGRDIGCRSSLLGNGVVNGDGGGHNLLVDAV